MEIRRIVCQIIKFPIFPEMSETEEIIHDSMNYFNRLLSSQPQKRPGGPRGSRVLTSERRTQVLMS